MSKRPILEKKLRRLEKALTRQTPERYIDLIQWLKDHGHAQTTGAARRLLLDGKVKADSHVVGRGIITYEVNGEERRGWAVFEHVPVALKSGLAVVK